MGVLVGDDAEEILEDMMRVRQDKREKYETTREHAARQLAELLEDVVAEATGRCLTESAKTLVRDRCGDIMMTVVEAVQEESRSGLW